MDDREYSNKVFVKLSSYNTYGIVPFIQLIMTFETKDNPLSSETVENIIEQYFCQANRDLCTHISSGIMEDNIEKVLGKHIFESIEMKGGRT